MNCYMNKRYLRTKVKKNMKIKKASSLTTSSNQFFILSLLPWSFRRLRTMNDFHPSDNEAQVSHSKHRGNPPRMFIMASVSICRVFSISLDLLFSLPFSFFFAETLSAALCVCKWWCCRPFQSPYIFPLYSSPPMAEHARFTARVTRNDAFHFTANDTSARSRLSRSPKQFVFNCSFSICLPDFFRLSFHSRSTQLFSLIDEFSECAT